MPKRINPVAQYLICLALSVFTYYLYAYFAVPLIEGPPNLVKRPTASSASRVPKTVDHKAQYKSLFPENAWELGNSNMLLTSQGKIIFEDYDPQPDGTLIVFPFTLIMEPNEEAKQASTPPKPPTILRCMQKAVIKFDRPFAFGSKAQGSSSGKMESAQLKGEVLIYRPPSAKGESDGMQIVTSNVQITEKNIYTLEQVDFMFGQNRGTGRNLLIDLAYSEPTSALTTDISNVDGIRRLELAFLHKLRIEPGSTKTNSLAVNSPPTQPKTGQLLSNKKTPLEITCQGPFVFDVEAKTVSLRDQVVVTQDDVFRDSLSCHKLDLFLEGNETTINPMKDGSSGMRLKRIVAKGNPAIINAVSRSSRLSGQVLDYNLEDNIVVAQSQTGSVTIISKEYQFDARSFKYIVPKGKGLGPLTAWGPGRMVRPATKTDKEFRATWKDQLTISDQSDGKKLIQMLGRSSVSLDVETEIQADELRFWLWKNQTGEPIQSDQNNQRLASGQNPLEKAGSDYKPSKVLAIGNVQITSEQISGTARQLVATWPKPVSSIPRNAQGSFSGQHTSPFNHNRPAPSNFRTQPAQASPTQISAVQRLRKPPLPNPPTIQELRRNQQQDLIAPTNRNFQIQPASFQQALETKRKFKFDGEQVEVRLSNHKTKDSKSAIRYLKINGNVTVDEIAKPGSTPLKVVGSELEMIPQGKDLYRIRVIGSPTRQAVVQAEELFLTGQELDVVPQAEETYRVKVLGSPNQQAVVRSQGMEMVGVQVHLDQSANKVWVDGAGNLKMAPDKKDRLSNSSSSPPSKIDVSWGGGMIFDGRVIYFEHNVIMQAAQQTKKLTTRKTRSLSQALSVQLKNRVDFRALANDETRKPEVEIDELVLINELQKAQRVFQLASTNRAPTKPEPIIVENQDFDRAGNLVSLQKIVVPKASVKTATGEIKASGPGVIMNHQLGKSGFAIGQDRKEGSSRTGLNYLQVNFDGSLVANMETEDMLISGNVRTLYTPVANWQQTFDPDTTIQIPTGGVKLTCENVEASRWQKRGSAKPTRDLIATGNAHIYGDQFEATANRVSYDETSDILTIEGTPRSDATLFYRQNPRAPKDKLVAGRILYRISDQWTKIDKIKTGTGNVSFGN